MAFNFDELTPEAKRAAFAHMRLGSGGRHKKLSAKKKAAVEHHGRGKVSGKLDSGTVKGNLTAADHDKGSMGGQLPIAKARPSARKAAATPKATADTPEARFDNHTTSHIEQLTRGKGRYASLAALRKALDQQGYSRSEQDTHLKRMNRERKINLVPEDNRKVLRQEDHDAAVRLGSDDNHLVSLLPPTAAAAAVKPSPSTDVKKLAASRTEADHADLAQKYLQMHGDAGVEKKIAALSKRKRLGPGERAQLAALKNLRKKPQAAPEWPS
ncbi:hypothetical protein AB0J55_17740 [Amycolatopsis sp. NPDC049688]|uniref:hypothetical protein n=1 Tax=Amycolatopsis sp. NPDC049688 TaxID=3154733 RepID=UPI0034332D59